MKTFLGGLGFSLMMSLSQSAHAQTVTPPPVPDNLEVPPTNQAFRVGHGVGTQNYVWAPGSSLG
jgi:hypothetical protein